VAVAEKIYQGLAQKGILVRVWVLPDSQRLSALLRFGLIDKKDSAVCDYFQRTIAEISASL
jgi:hypothetical protein